MDKTKVAVTVFNQLANRYQEKYMDVSMYHNSFDLFCDCLVNQEAQILELACGPGNITQYLLQKRPDLKILGTDLAPNMIELAKKNNPTAEFQLMDCRDLNSLSKKYDGIMCGFCLPYLSKEDTLQLIADASKLLKPKGVIYLSTMEDDYTKSGMVASSTGEEIYIHYHQADYLEDALLKNGFEICKLQRLSSSSHNNSEVTDLLIVAQLK